MNKFYKTVILISILFCLPLLFLFIIPDISIKKYIKNISKNYESFENDKNPDKNKLIYPYVLEGKAKDGAEVYKKMACNHCHTQMIRPTYAGSDLLRFNWGGREAGWDDGIGDSLARETLPEDYLGEEFANLGLFRYGPDLSNVGHRYTNKNDLYKILYNPRDKKNNSIMPSYKNLFKKRKINGKKSNNAILISDDKKYEIVPTYEAQALIDYLSSLKKDQVAPK